MECMNLNNFGGMGAIMAGLNNSYVQSFKENWSELDGEPKKNFEKMEELLSPSFNFALYRKTVEEIEKEAKKPYLPYMAIHLRDILSLQEIFENSEEAKEMIEHSIENGKKIFSALKAQNIKFELKKETEIYEYMKSVKPLSSRQIFDLQFNKTSEELENSSIRNPKKLLNDKDINSEASKEDSLYIAHTNKHPERNSLYKIKENFFLSYMFKKTLAKNENLSKWYLCKALKDLYVIGVDEEYLFEKMREIFYKYFLNEKIHNVKKKKKIFPVFFYFFNFFFFFSNIVTT